MTAEHFRQAIDRASGSRLEEHPWYWFSFKRGLQRAHFGERVVGDDEHSAWLRLASDPDPRQQERARGYVDGWSWLKPAARVTC